VRFVWGPEHRGRVRVGKTVRSGNNGIHTALVIMVVRTAQDVKMASIQNL
jgi:hypothetical protein